MSGKYSYSQADKCKRPESSLTDKNTDGDLILPMIMIFQISGERTERSVTSIGKNLMEKKLCIYLIPYTRVSPSGPAI